MNDTTRMLAHEASRHDGAQTVWDGDCNSCSWTTGECLDSRDASNPCKGDVEYRYALSGTGRSFPRCDKHWDERLKVQEGINRRYPVTAPSDFDPSYAGESWDDD